MQDSNEQEQGFPSQKPSKNQENFFISTHHPSKPALLQGLRNSLTELKTCDHKKPKITIL